MKNFIFCTCFVDESDIHNNERYARWIKYYSNKLAYLKSSHLFLIDDGSRCIDLGNDVSYLDPCRLPSELSSTINVLQFKNNLGRSSQVDYLGWWRSFTYSIILAKKYGFEKIIHIESDFFILSRRLFEYIGSVFTGWVALYSRFHDFPESAIQVICKDNFAKLEKIYQLAEKKEYKMGMSAELCLPFTLIEKNYLGDRLGQLDVFDEWVTSNTEKIKLDYIGQILPDHEVDDFKPYFDFEYGW